MFFGISLRKGDEGHSWYANLMNANEEIEEAIWSLMVPQSESERGVAMSNRVCLCERRN